MAANTRGRKKQQKRFKKTVARSHPLGGPVRRSSRLRRNFTPPQQMEYTWKELTYRGKKEVYPPQVARPGDMVEAHALIIDDDGINHGTRFMFEKIDPETGYIVGFLKRDDGLILKVEKNTHACRVVTGVEAEPNSANMATRKRKRTPTDKQMALNEEKEKEKKSRKTSRRRATSQTTEVEAVTETDRQQLKEFLFHNAETDISSEDEQTVTETVAKQTVAEQTE